MVTFAPDNTKKKIVYVPSGGKGSDEIMSEAEAIKNYLVQQGIHKNQIVLQNCRYSICSAI